MNRTVNESCRALRKIASAAFKEKMTEAILLAFACRIIIQAPSILYGFLPANLQTSLIANLVNIYSIMINGPASLGLCHYFVNAFRENQNDGISELKFGFDNFSRAFILFIRIRLITWLLSLFFLIPGIIASINYSQAFFILNDNPDKPAAICMFESKYIMQRNRLKYLSLMLTYLPLYVFTLMPSVAARMYLDASKLSQIPDLLFEGNVESAVFIAYDMHPLVPALMLLTAAATAFIMPAQAVFFDILSGKLEIHRADSDFEDAESSKEESFENYSCNYSCNEAFQASDEEIEKHKQENQVENDE